MLALEMVDGAIALETIDVIEITSEAAEVYCSLTATSPQVQNKPSHLYEISKTDSEHWQMLVDLLIKCDWSVKETQAAVKRVNPQKQPRINAL